MSEESKQSQSKHEESYRRFLLQKNLDILKNKTGFHTALVTLYVPPTRKIFDVIAYLNNEISESSNIKDKNNRKNVLDSIKQLIGRLKTFKELPDTGLILFAGQIPVNMSPGTEKSELYVIVPPEPITTFKYYCASQFLLDPLYDMIKEKGSYGIICIENKDAAVGWIRGSHLEVSKTMNSGNHGKFSAGGQSQRRLERLIEEGAQYFYTRVGEVANQVFLELSDLEGIFVSGGGMTKEKFVEKGVLDYRIKDKVIGLVDTGYSGEEGIRETVIKIQDKLKNLRYVQEKKLFTRYMNEVVKDTGKATYGEKDVRKALESGAVEILLLSEKLEKMHLIARCSQCNYHEERTVSLDKIPSVIEEYRVRQCPQCATNQFQVAEQINIIEFLGQLAEVQGTTIEMFSRETEEGESLYATFGGIAALLRFKTFS